jgi:creatinine amidohydrolase
LKIAGPSGFLSLSFSLLFCSLGVATPALAQDKPAARAEPESTAKPLGILLERLSWYEAERVLTPDQVVVIALGAESKEHGMHLPLNNDWVMAEYFKERVLARAAVIVAPTINYSYYPAFLEYPGSVSVRSDVARDLVADIVRSLAHYGPRRFYIINTGISTLKPLTQAASLLAGEGILLRYLDFTQDDPVEKKLRKSGGTHADEIETSMMLYIAPEVVHMEKAKRDLNANQPGGLTRDPKGKGTYSPTGAWGDPTLASREEGQAIVEAEVKRILDEIEQLRRTSLPAH